MQGTTCRDNFKNTMYGEMIKNSERKENKRK